MILILEISSPSVTFQCCNLFTALPAYSDVSAYSHLTPSCAVDNQTATCTSNTLSVPNSLALVAVNCGVAFLNIPYFKFPESTQSQFAKLLSSICHAPNFQEPTRSHPNAMSLSSTCNTQILQESTQSHSAKFTKLIASMLSKISTRSCRQ